MRSKLITVLLTNYNHSNLVPRAITAIKNQTLRPYELIISDDCSTDNSVEVIKKHIKNFKWIKLKQNEKNLGVIENANSMLGYAKTKYILFAAADDFLLPDYLERAEKYLNKYSNVALFTATTLTYSRELGTEGFYASKIISIKPKYLSPVSFKKNIKKYSNFIKGATSVYRTDLIKETNGLLESIGSYSDTYASYYISNKSGCVFDPCPGAVCERFITGFASSQMRNHEKIYSILKEISNTKYNLPNSLYNSIVIPLFIRYFTIKFIQTYELLWKKINQEKFINILKQFISIYTYSHFYGKLFFITRIKSILELKFNEIFFKIIISSKIKNYNNYILELIKKI